MLTCGRARCVVRTDGQVTRPSDTPDDEFSRHEKATMEAIVRASGTPLSIVLVGVGDGPWDMMQVRRGTTCMWR